MCGFVGFTNYINDDGLVLGSMMDTIVHRGPDAEGKYIDDDIALGFRRLSIIDLEGGNQPMLNEDQSKILVFNGEIYNYKLLREELIENGHTFSTNADSEVVLHGFEQWGADVVKRLRGMFAFVIFNKDDRSIFGARDMFGIKPFYYTTSENSFIFASEIKAFLPHPSLRKNLTKRLLRIICRFSIHLPKKPFLRAYISCRRLIILCLKTAISKKHATLNPSLIQSRVW